MVDKGFLIMTVWVLSWVLGGERILFLVLSRITSVARNDRKAIERHAFMRGVTKEYN